MSLPRKRDTKGLLSLETGKIKLEINRMWEIQNKKPCCSWGQGRGNYTAPRPILCVSRMSAETEKNRKSAEIVQMAHRSKLKKKQAQESRDAALHLRLDDCGRNQGG